MSSINFPNYKSITHPIYSSDERPANEVARECIIDYKSTLKDIAQHLQLDQSITTLTYNINKAKEITFLIPASDEYDISLTSPTTRIAFSISVIALTIFSGAFGALVGSLIAGLDDYSKVFGSALICVTPPLCLSFWFVACILDLPKPKNTKIIYDELISRMKPEITFIKSAFKAITSPDEDAISQAFDEIFSSSFNLDRKIPMINSIIESAHKKTSFYAKWRKMSDEIQKLLDDPNIKNKGSHENLAPLSKLVQELQIPSLTQFYATANLNSYEHLSCSKLENSKSLANQINISKERLSWIFETHEFFISESFTKKIEQIKKTVCNTKNTDLQNLDLTTLV
ncbi:MAG: hypothetical protein VX777_05445 [Chlamydiota bacterium]|nr:hypothetical protein [Chlamydiota bacterium]